MDGFNTVGNNFWGDKFNIVSTVGYLIGVKRSTFTGPDEPMKLSIYNELQENKNARVIRNLCRLRTKLLGNHISIDRVCKSQYRTPLNVSEYVPQDILAALSEDGIDLGQGKKKNKKTSHASSAPKTQDYIIAVNDLICDRINNVRDLFPVFIKWEYIRDLFVMANNAGNIKREELKFFKSKPLYPYRCYIQWTPEDHGNILYSDQKFVTILYLLHNDSFTAVSKVQSVKEPVKNKIYDFIDGSRKIVMVVDCENSDAFKLCATLRDMDEEMVAKISKVILCDDVNFTPDAWRIFQEHISIPVEHILTERIKHEKSLVDVKFTAAVCREHFANEVDSFMLVASDSDYYGLIDSLPDARFLVMVEREKVSKALESTLSRDGIFVSYIDDFYSGDSQDLADHALMQGIRSHFDQFVGKLNINDMLRSVSRTTGVHMSACEEEQFKKRYLKTLTLSIDDATGDVAVNFGSRW